MTRIIAVGNVLLGVVAALAVALLLGATVLPNLLNYRTYTVLSGSMEPSIRAGSIIVATPVDPGSLKVGDVINFNLNEFPQLESVTHRILEIRGTSTRPTFVTKGDANPVADDWEVAPQGSAGKVLLSVPLAGYFLHAVGSPRGRLIFLVVPAVALALIWVWDIWRPRKKPEGTDHPSAVDRRGRPDERASLGGEAISESPTPDSPARLPLRK